MFEGERITGTAKYQFGILNERLQLIYDRLQKMESYEERMSNIEKDIVLTKNDISNINSDISEIKDTIRPQRGRWVSIASGIVSILAILTFLVPILALA